MDPLDIPLLPRHGDLIQWPKTPEGWCAHFKRLDARYNTDKRSPLHHDNRCTLCGAR